MSISIDGCADVPDPRLIESDTEIHLLINLKLDFGGNMPACLGGAVIHLAQPIGARKVIDDRHHHQIPITWMPISPPVHLDGSVRDVLGQEGNATVTAWLLVDRSGAAVLCDDLPSDATACPTATIGVDWSYGTAKPPTDLRQRGDVMVSAGPISLSGSIKADVLNVGLTW